LWQVLIPPRRATENLTFDLVDAAPDAVDAAVAVQPDLERHRLLVESIKEKSRGI
jgi:hypothetical protein